MNTHTRKQELYMKRHIEGISGLGVDDINSYDELFSRIQPAMRRGDDEHVAIGNLFKFTYVAFIDALVADVPPQRVVRYLRLAKEIGVIHFSQILVEPDETFSAAFDGELVEFCGRNKSDYIDSNTWWRVFYCAMLMKDIEAINTLCKVMPKHFAQANIPSDSFDLALVSLLQGMFQRGSDIASLLEQALTTDVEGSKERERYANLLLVPLLPIIRNIYTTDAEAEFNAAFKEAVEMHQGFWKKSKCDSEGWISVPLTALAQFAKLRNGYELKFGTDYIPTWLVNGDVS